MFQIQNDSQSRAAAGERQRDFGSKRRSLEDSVEEQRYTSRPRRKRLRNSEAELQNTAADLVANPFQADLFRGAPSPFQQQHDRTWSEPSRELGISHVQESAGPRLSGRLELGKIELQKNQNTTFFPSSSNLRVVDSNFSSFRDQIVSTRNSNVFINVDRPKSNETVFVRVPTGEGSEASPEVSNIEISSLKKPLQIRKSSEIYYRHLLTLGRGSPLWIPEPSTSLPIEYQKAGIGIGDVGILTESGGFDFLFNVYQPSNDSNHPINPRTMPDNFFPLCLPEERDVNSHLEFKKHSFLTSSHINSRHDESLGFIFESSAEDGAILTMPRGAKSIDLDNMGMLRRYVSKNVQQWYTYTNEVRGRDARNGDLRLVIGKTSATTWGMATFSRESDEDTPSCLKFKPTPAEDSVNIGGRDASSPNHRWEYSGNVQAEAKSGPDEDEVEKLREFDRLRGDNGQTTYENQCLFMRTINVTLQDWRRRPSNVASPPLMFTDPHSPDDKLFGVLGHDVHQREPVALHPSPKSSQVVELPEHGMPVGFDEEKKADSDYDPFWDSDCRIGQRFPVNVELSNAEPDNSTLVPNDGPKPSVVLSQNHDIQRLQAGLYPRETEPKMLPPPTASSQQILSPTTGTAQSNMEQSLKGQPLKIGQARDDHFLDASLSHAYSGGGNKDRQMVQESELYTALSGFPNSSLPLPGDLHPSTIINEYLLSLVPIATMAMTEDSDWISVLNESDTIFPEDDVLLSRIMRMYEVKFEEGVVFLQRRTQSIACFTVGRFKSRMLKKEFESNDL